MPRWVWCRTEACCRREEQAAVAMPLRTKAAADAEELVFQSVSRRNEHFAG
jgi:hypothetical protein